MKVKVLVIVCLFNLTGCLLAQPAATSLNPKVDKRVELLSIAFRLAGNKDFNDHLNPLYANAIDNHFKKYVNHPLIKYIVAVSDSLNKNNIEWGYWSVEALAVHLNQPPFFEPIVSLEDISDVDGWEDRVLLNTKMAGLLRAFYNDAQCDAFFKNQQSYYAAVEGACKKKVPQINTNWIKDFFLITASENYYPIICLSIRMGGYTRINFKNNRRNTYTFFETKSFDNNGIPVNFSDEYFPRMMLHEYIHAYTNQLVDENIKTLQPYAEIILVQPKVADRVKNTFYDNWQFLLYESFVRASCIVYMKHNSEIKTTAEKEISLQEKAGFFWIKGLVELLDEQMKNQTAGKNIKAIMPKIISFFNDVADKMKEGRFNYPN